MVPRRLIVPLVLVAAAPAWAAASLDAAIGRRLFERNWVAAPSSTASDDGLGPLYDAPSCASCHQKRAATDDDTIAPGTVIRLGNGWGEGDPFYGVQLQTRSVAGAMPEAHPNIAWTEKGVLRVPAIDPLHLGYGPLAADTRMGLRRAPPIDGIGLLAQVPDSEILKRADTEDANHDGIAGRAAWIYVNGTRVLGRFGWRATQPDLVSQIAAAFSRDIGLSTRIFPDPWGDCTAGERACRASPHGAERGQPEIADEILDRVAAYVASLPAPPPARPGTGEKLFGDIGCAACHATLHLANGAPVRAYTDLLLHDMGAGLGDGMEEGAADAWFWRTAPLWNLRASLPARQLLHDGRARDVQEAIEWHGGEAEEARLRFRALAPADKAALLAFVNGL